MVVVVEADTRAERQEFDTWSVSHDREAQAHRLSANAQQTVLLVLLHVLMEFECMTKHRDEALVRSTAAAAD